jgi:hypothetical protein
MVNGEWSMVNGFPKFKTHASDFSLPIFYPCHGLKPCHGSFRHPPSSRLRRGKKKPASLEAGFYFDLVYVRFHLRALQE